MDRIIRRFEKLFSVRFTHPEFPHAAQAGGLLGDFIRLTPDEPTRALLSVHDMHFRWNRDILLCFIRIREDETTPYVRLPNVLTMRLFFEISPDLRGVTQVPDTHGGEQLYRFRINFRSSSTELNLTSATLGTVQNRVPERIFNSLDRTWETSILNLKGYFGVIDFVTEGGSSHRLYSDVDQQTLFYTAANGNEHEHLFTIHLGN